MPSPFHPTLRGRDVLLVAALALPFAGKATASQSDGFFGMTSPEATEYILLQSGTGARSASAQVVELTGSFAESPRTEVWASQEVRFVPGFSAQNTVMLFHVGERAGVFEKPGSDVAEKVPVAFSVSVTQQKNSVLLQYNLPDARLVTYRVFAPSGKVLVSRNMGVKHPGAHAENLNTSTMANGIHVLHISAGNQTLIHRFGFVDR